MNPITAGNGTTGLLSLPTELLIEVLQHSRPDGFEGLMMTCKRLYSAGAHVIEDHGQCKVLVRELQDMCGPLMFLARFLELVPSRLRMKILQYFKHIHVDDFGDWETNKGAGSAQKVSRLLTCFQTIQSETPWLVERLQHIFANFPKFQASLEKRNPQFGGCNHWDDDSFCFGMLLQYSVLQVAPTKELNENMLVPYDKKYFPPSFFSSTLCCLFPNLEVLNLDSWSWTATEEKFPDSHCFSTLIQEHALNGRHLYFQNLRAVYIRSDVYLDSTLKSYVPFLLLPSLQHLSIGENEDHLYGRRLRLGCEQPRTSTSPYGSISTRSLEWHLKVAQVYTSVQSMKTFLYFVKPLSKLTWTAYNAWGPFSTLPNFDNKPWTTAGALDAIKQLHGGTITHLTFNYPFITSDGLTPRMISLEHVREFCGFSRLTHLEITPEILGLNPELEWNNIQSIPLRRMLPKTIEVLCINFSYSKGWSKHMPGILRELRDVKMPFSKLRRIEVKGIQSEASGDWCFWDDRVRREFAKLVKHVKRLGLTLKAIEM